MKKLVFAFVFLLGAFIIISQFTSVQRLAEVLCRGEWHWLLLALFLQWVGSSTRR